jgi:hypothetical protein
MERRWYSTYVECGNKMYRTKLTLRVGDKIRVDEDERIITKYV